MCKCMFINVASSVLVPIGADTLYVKSWLYSDWLLLLFEGKSSNALEISCKDNPRKKWHAFFSPPSCWLTATMLKSVSSSFFLQKIQAELSNHCQGVLISWIIFLILHPSFWILNIQIFETFFYQIFSLDIILKFASTILSFQPALSPYWLELIGDF